MFMSGHPPAGPFPAIKIRSDVNQTKKLLEQAVPEQAEGPDIERIDFDRLSKKYGFVFT